MKWKKLSKGEAMKTYVFGAKNWKNDYGMPFWFHKKFPSAYLADRWAMKITFSTRNSPYMVWLVPGKEI